MPKQIIKINASSLPWMRCSLLWHRKCIQGYKTKLSDAAPIYGVAIHAFIHNMIQSKGDMAVAVKAMNEAFRVPKVEDRKSPYLSDEKHLCGVAFDYWTRYVSKDSTCDLVILPDGKPATEVTFEIDYYEDNFIKVILAGTIDKIVKIKNGPYCIGDYKTTRSDDEYYLKDFEMSQQLRFYLLSLKLMAEFKPESALGKIGSTMVGCFIDGIFLKPKLSDCYYKRSEVFPFKDKEITELRAMIDMKIAELSHRFAVEPKSLTHREGIFYNNCKSYGRKCEFWSICRVNDPAIEKVLLERDFRQVEYDPLHHND